MKLSWTKATGGGGQSYARAGIFQLRVFRSAMKDTPGVVVLPPEVQTRHGGTVAVETEADAEAMRARGETRLLQYEPSYDAARVAAEAQLLSVLVTAADALGFVLVPKDTGSR